MNTPNNKRRQDTQRRIETVFVDLLQNRRVEDITVTEICQRAGVNRSTFYANYVDVYDLAAKIGERLAAEVGKLYEQERETSRKTGDPADFLKTAAFDVLKLIRNIYDNRSFYRAYFKLGLDDVDLISHYDYDHEAADKLFGGHHVDYHMTFFMAGFNAMVKRWLMDDCPFPPEEFVKILEDEYRRNV